MEYNNSITRTLKIKIFPLLLSMIMVFLSSCVTSDLSPEIEREFVDSLKSNNIDKAADLLKIYPELGSKEIIGTFEGKSHAVPAILFALKFGDLNLVKLILKYQDDIDIEFLGLTALKYAIGLNKNDVVQFLIEEGADVNHCSQKSTGTPLIHSVVVQNIEALKFLLNRDVDVNKSSFNTTDSPLGYAVFNKYFVSAKMLIDKGAIGQEDENYQILIDVAMYLPRSLPVLGEKVDWNSYSDKSSFIVGSVLISKSLENLKLVIDKLNIENEIAPDIVPYLAYSSDELFDYLDNQFELNYLYRNRNNKTVLHMAVENINFPIVKHLVKLLSDKNLYTQEYQNELIDYYYSEQIQKSELLNILKNN